MTTLQAVLDLARIELNDDDKSRWTDPVLLGYANSAIRQAFKVRPDLRLGSYATPFTDLAVGGTFPIPDDYKRAVADYIIGRAQSVENDEAEVGRSALFMGAFDKQMIGL